MRWTRVLQQHGYQVETTDGTDIDPFLWLAQQAKARGEAVATISYRTSLEFSTVACTVTISCPQDEHSINLAGEIAFRKAHELTNDGANLMGEPPLPSID